MTKLKTLTLPLGSSTNRMVLDQTQVDTLINVYYDDGIVNKNVNGYVFKSTIKNREYNLLTLLGLDVAYETLQTDKWSMAADNSALSDGDSATLSIGGELDVRDVVFEIGDITVTEGTATESQIRQWITLEKNVLSFSKGDATVGFGAQITISAHPSWNDQECKTLTIVLSGQFRTVWINPSTQSAALTHIGNRTLLEDYVRRSLCYVFNADGTKKAEIKSATFVGNYSGMTSGTVTFADDTVVDIAVLNAAGCNFMVYRPELHVWCGDEGDGEILRCTGIYGAGNGEKVWPGKYIGMFKAFVQNNVLKSQPNRIPTGEQTIATFMMLAKAGGNDYGIWSYGDWQKENALHLTWFANTNYENNVGLGRIGGDQNAYNRVRNIVTGFTLPLAGQNKCGKATTVDSAGNAVNCLNFFGIEGLGEQIWEFVTGFRHDGVTAYIWEDNTWDEIHAADRTFALQVTSSNQQYIKSIIAGSHFDMLPKAVGASATTGMCDGHWMASSGRLLFVGGRAANGSICGLSASNANYGFSASDAHIGARLAFIGEPETVSGSELLT